MPSQTILFIKNVDDRDAGRWVCKASNQYGEQKLEIVLKVNLHLSAHINPQIQIINSGSTAFFNCSTSGSPNDIEWFHNGKPVVYDIQQGNSK